MDLRYRSAFSYSCWEITYIYSVVHLNIFNRKDWRIPTAEHIYCSTLASFRRKWSWWLYLIVFPLSFLPLANLRLCFPQNWSRKAAEKLFKVVAMYASPLTSPAALLLLCQCPISGMQGQVFVTITMLAQCFSFVHRICWLLLHQEWESLALRKRYQPPWKGKVLFKGVFKCLCTCTKWCKRLTQIRY